MTPGYLSTEPFESIVLFSEPDIYIKIIIMLLKGHADITQIFKKNVNIWDFFILFKILF